MNIETPYLKHKSFQTKNRFKLKNKIRFNDLYNEALIKWEKNKTVTLFNELDLIKEELVSQAINKNEEYFLNELFEKSKIILNSDLETFKNRDFNIYDSKTTLEKKGFIKVNLSENSITKINRLSKKFISKFRENVNLGKTNRTDLQVNSGATIRKIVKILNKDFISSGIISEVSKYMGCDYEVSGCSLELSTSKATWWKKIYPEYDKFPKTTYFHFDESIQNPKALVYLNCVDQSNGAFSINKDYKKYISISPIQKLIGRAIRRVGKDKSSKLTQLYKKDRKQVFECEKLRKDFSKLPNELLFNSHFGWDIIPDSKLENILLNDEIKFNGCEGTAIIFDGGNTLHRGGLVNDGERIALQLVFSKKENLKYVKKFFKKLSR